MPSGIVTSGPGQRKDPYTGFNFLIEIEGIISGGFTEVGGLSIQTEVEKKSFGGENDREYTFIKGTKFSDITLKRGMSDTDLLSWYEDVISGKIERKNGTIHLRNISGENVLSWHFIEAVPVKWDGPGLNAASSTVATETLVLVHHGLIRSK